MASTTSYSGTQKRKYDDYRQPFKRSEVKRPRKMGSIVAWDIETDNIPDAPAEYTNRNDALRDRARSIIEEQRMTFAPIDDAIAQVGGLVCSVVWSSSKRRYVVAGEYADVPRSRYRRPAVLPIGAMRIDGNLDKIADIAGCEEADVLDAISTRRKSWIDAMNEAAREIPAPDPEEMMVGVKYLTAFGEDIRVSERVDDDTLAWTFVERMLTIERKGTRFVAWNANRFDTLYLLKALRRSFADRFVIKPFVAGQGGLRGARIYLRENPKIAWDLMDGMAMTGIQLSLADFTKKFAPECSKLTGAIDFSKERFDPSNPRHVEYAERDAEALYRAMMEVERIVVELTGRQLRMTIGAAAIRLFEAHIPEGVHIHAVTDRLWDHITERGMRGGFVYVARQHDGPAWQYDANQAYGAAMRDARLPAGRSIFVDGEVEGAVGFYDCTIERSERSPIPFYCKNDLGPVECYGERTHTFIASCEIETLRRWGWSVDVHFGWIWNGSFNMQEMVDKLEAIRTTDVDGPSGPVGTMAKYLGCNAYGKTTERLSHETLIISDGPPEDETGWTRYRPEDPAFDGFWVKVTEEIDRRRYHRPQIGAIITAHVRMSLFDSIMVAPDSFLKCDTDSLCFDRPVDHLDLDEKRYGAWKLEVDGLRMIVIGKKVYAIVKPDGTMKAVCKGLNVKRLTLAQMEAWISSGNPPRQAQVQSLGWRRGLPQVRYRIVGRTGTDFRRSAPHLYMERTG